MSRPPVDMILTDATGLARATVGFVTVWEHHLAAIRGAEWTSDRGTIFMRTELAPDGSRVSTPIFRSHRATLDEPLANFAGFTQP